MSKSVVQEDMSTNSNFIEILEYHPVGIIHRTNGICAVCRCPLINQPTDDDNYIDQKYHPECKAAYDTYCSIDNSN